MSKHWLGLLLFGVWITGGVAHATVDPQHDPLEMGTVVVGQSPATVNNNLTGNGNNVNVRLALHDLPAGTCAGFTILAPSGTFNLNNNQTTVAMIRFAPTSAGDKSCDIDLVQQGGGATRLFTAHGTAPGPTIEAVLPTLRAEVGKSATGQLTVTARMAPLTITSAMVTAGAEFTATPSDPPGTLAIGDHATWDITCNPTTTFGDRTGTFTIVSDAVTATGASDSPKDLSVICTGTQGVLSTGPTTAIQFTAVPRGATQTRTFALNNIGNLPVGAIAATIDPPDAGYSVDALTLTTLTATTGTELVTVSFKPVKNTSGGPATIHFAGTWGTSNTPIPALSIAIDGGKDASYALSPAQPTLDFGKFRYDDHTGKSFQLLNDGGAELSTNARFVPDPDTTQAGEYKVQFASGAVDISQPATLASGDHLTVVVSPQVAQRVGVVSGHIDITSNLGVPVLQVPVTGIATAAEVDFPATVSFGVVDLNSPPVKQAIAIKNTGTGPLDIRSITPSVPGLSGPSSGAFAIALPDIPRQIAADESLTIEVTYQPMVATADASDVVNLNAQLAGSLDLGLSIQVSGKAEFFQAHGSGGCDAGDARRGGGLATIVLTALIAPLVLWRRSRRRAALAVSVATCVVVAVALMLAPAARADGIALSVFAPTPSTAGEGFALQTPEIGAAGSWVANAVVSYASNPLVVEAPGLRSTPVSRSTLMQVGLAYALFGRLELGAHLPLYQQSGDMPTSPDAKQVKGTAAGNLAVHAKARLLRAQADLGTVALGASAIAALPTATRGQLTGADQPEGRLLVLGSFTPAALDGRINVSVNAGPMIRKRSSYENITQKSGAAWGGGLSVRILDELWAGAELFGETTPSASDQKQTAAPATAVSVVEWLAGLTIKPDRRVSVGMAVGRGLTAAIGTPDLRGVVTLSIVPGAAPLAPIRPVVPDGDADGDGIPDSVDQCPHQPEDKDGFQDADGCPDPDNDRDGIPDVKDKCPLDPEDKDGFEDADGCPDPDNDHDGIPDKLDKCPNDPEDKDGFEDLDGCPDPDNDRDGIPDEKDKCPNEPETINGVQDDDGCPDKGDSTIILSPDKIETLDPIQFTGIKLTRGATPLIEQVGATLRAHPEILRVRVTVHVQPTGDPEADQQKTDKRAQAARDWLIQWGVAPTRLEVRGFGGTKPLVAPDQRNAAKLNERIEFIILERK